jgi:hypothetical protein
MPFADERAFLEHVLVHVGHFTRIRIDARVASKEPDEPGTAGARQADADARLQDAVAFHHAANGIELGRFNGWAMVPTSCRAASRGSWVSVSSVMTYRMAGRMVSPIISEKHSAGTAAEQGVELHELAALALVAHPQAFAGIPAARPMKQEKAVLLADDTCGSAISTPARAC